MAIPHNISKDHIEKALNEVDPSSIPRRRWSYQYFMEYKGQMLPPKYIISIANKYANGVELESEGFNAIEAKNYLLKLGYPISENKEEFYGELLKFLEQTKTNNLATGDYLPEYQRLTVKVGFGKGNIARVPWVAFLKEPHTVQKGIYPVYLYYKEKGLLVLAYGVSEAYDPPISWDIENAQTIKSFFEEKFSEKPPRYGASMVYQTYDVKNDQLDKEQIESDLNNILNKYYEVLEEKPPSPGSGKVHLSIGKRDIKAIKEYIAGKGYQYHYEEVANFLLSIKTKPFVILAGISGTGKTQLPRKFAEAVGMERDHVIQVPVRPDWTDGSDLLGYTGLDDAFKPKDLTLAIQEATRPDNRNKPFFFLLDEMNLARVEHYFSDFLSVIETREWTNGKGSKIKTDPILRKEILHNATNKDGFDTLTWPDNLYLIGTVNMDETTHAFSRKVLDRANSIEMNEVDLEWIRPEEKSQSSSIKIDNSFFKTEYLGAIDLSEKERDIIRPQFELLKKVNRILEKADLHFAYRVRDEVAFYLTLNKRFELLDPKTAMDFQLVQKVLPRIHGSSERIQSVLVDLLNLLENKDFRTEDVDSAQVFSQMKDSNEFKYPRASKKILFMLKRFDDDRFTSFWL